MTQLGKLTTDEEDESSNIRMNNWIRRIEIARESIVRLSNDKIIKKIWDVETGT